MTLNLVQNPVKTSRRWVESLNERPPEITTGRWRAMQKQVALDRLASIQNQNLGEDEDLVFWLQNQRT